MPTYESLDRTVRVNSISVLRILLCVVHEGGRQVRSGVWIRGRRVRVKPRPPIVSDLQVRIPFAAIEFLPANPEAFSDLVRQGQLRISGDVERALQFDAVELLLDTLRDVSSAEAATIRRPPSSSDRKTTPKERQFAREDGISGKVEHKRTANGGDATGCLGPGPKLSRRKFVTFAVGASAVVLTPASSVSAFSGAQRPGVSGDGTTRSSSPCTPEEFIDVPTSLTVGSSREPIAALKKSDLERLAAANRQSVRRSIPIVL